jgi:osmotically-inducible protein OsmY
MAEALRRERRGATPDRGGPRSTDVDESRISVEAKGGEVTLNGTARSWAAEREEAERIAWQAQGTTTVDNAISIQS